MAKGAVLFDKLYQEGRKQKRNEELAQEIFGSKSSKGRSSLGRGGIQKSQSTNSLCARIDKAPSAAINRRSKLDRNKAGHDLFLTAAQAVLDQQSRQAPPARLPSKAPELQIRGAAGPYTVWAENFATGTTAADIESVMQSVGGEVVFCNLVPRMPVCTAEIAFATKSGADKVINTFHNKKADGRILRVYLRDIRDDPHIQENGIGEIMDLDGSTTAPPIDTPDRSQAYSRAAERQDRPRVADRGTRYSYDTPNDRLGYRDEHGNGGGYSNGHGGRTQHNRPSGRDRYGR